VVIPVVSVEENCVVSVEDDSVEDDAVVSVEDDSVEGDPVGFVEGDPVADAPVVSVEENCVVSVKDDSVEDDVVVLGASEGAELEHPTSMFVSCTELSLEDVIGKELFSGHEALEDSVNSILSS
jgi:hypothetical protein